MMFHSRELVSVGNVKDPDLCLSWRERNPAAILQCWQRSGTEAAGELEGASCQRVMVRRQTLCRQVLFGNVALEWNAVWISGLWLRTGWEWCEKRRV